MGYIYPASVEMDSLFMLRWYFTVNLQNELFMLKVNSRDTGMMWDYEIRQSKHLVNTGWVM